MFIKHPYTAIFAGSTGVGNTHLVLDMTETQYNKHFDKIIILCPTIRQNKTYIGRSWVIKGENLWLVEAKDKLYDYIEKLSNLEPGNADLFIVDDIIADENLDKRRLLELAIRVSHPRSTQEPLSMAINPIVYFYSKISEKTSQGNIYMVSKRTW